jgi:hypothetical protein
MKQTFKARPAERGPGGAWTFLEIPFDVLAIFGRRDRVPVAGAMNGHEFQNSLLPQGDGTHAMAVSKELQAGAKAHAGDLVSVVMDIDLSERVVTVPEELRDAVASDPVAAETFKTLSNSHRKEFVEWVPGARKVETRRDRAEKTLALVTARNHAR